MLRRGEGVGVGGRSLNSLSYYEQVVDVIGGRWHDLTLLYMNSFLRAIYLYIKSVLYGHQHEKMGGGPKPSVRRLNWADGDCFLSYLSLRSCPRSTGYLVIHMQQEP